MTNIHKWITGDHNVICDVCNRKRKRSECVMAYGTGTLAVVMSCKDGCADINHPLNYPPPVIFDGRPVRDARPDQSVSYITIKSIYKWGSLNIGTWGAFNSLNNEFSLNPIITWGNF